MTSTRKSSRSEPPRSTQSVNRHEPAREEPSVPGPAPLDWFLCLAAALGFVLLSLLVYPYTVNHDAAINLHYGMLLAEGKLPYVDFVDTNPPLIAYLSWFPAMAARLLGGHPLPAFNAFVWLMLVYACFGIWKIVAAALPATLLRAAPPATRSASALTPSAGARLPFQAVAGIVALSWVAVSYWLISGPVLDWGQREHVYILLVTPGLMLRWARWRGLRIGFGWPLLFGALAAVGACLKPYFLLAVLAFELYGLAAHRRWRALLAPEIPAFLLTGLAYAVHFFLLPEPVRENFFGRYLGMIAAGYAAYSNPFLEVIAEPWIWFAAAVSLLVLIVTRRTVFKSRGPAGSEPESPSGASAGAPAGPFSILPIAADLARALAIFSLVSVLTFLMQRKGWFYHSIPAVYGAAGSVAALAGGWLGRRIERRRSAPASSRRALPAGSIGRLVVAGAVAASAIVLVDRYREGFDYKQPNFYAPMVEAHSEPGDPVLFITASVWRIYPRLLQMNRTAASRYLVTFPLAFAYAGEPGVPEGMPYPYHTAENMPPVEREFLDELAADIERYRPKLIFVDHMENPQALPEGFDVLRYLYAVDFVQQALREYDPVYDVNDMVVFVRRDVR